MNRDVERNYGSEKRRYLGDDRRWKERMEE